LQLIVLVGGFGNSDYLKQALEKWAEPHGIHCIRPNFWCVHCSLSLNHAQLLMPGIFILLAKPPLFEGLLSGVCKVIIIIIMYLTCYVFATG